LKYVENTKNIEAKSLLKQTNILLKKIGSKDQFIEKDKDLKYIIKNYFHNLKESLLLKISDKKIFLDKETHSYVKTLVLYKKYKEKNEELRKELLANAIVFIYPVGNNKDKKDLLLAKRAVISQNLSLLKAKIN
jgi:hypothetical protein